MNTTRLRHAIRAAADHQILETRQIMVLLAIHEAGSRSTGDIARDCAVSKPAVTRATSALVQRGLVLSIEDPKDRRRVMLNLTDSGAMAVAAILKAGTA